jgi:hypothetical protein
VRLRARKGTDALIRIALLMSRVGRCGKVTGGGVPSAPSPGYNAQLSLALSLSLSYSYTYTLSYAPILGLAHILKCVCRKCVCFGLRALLVPRSP